MKSDAAFVFKGYCGNFHHKIPFLTESKKYFRKFYSLAKKGYLHQVLGTRCTDNPREKEAHFISLQAYEEMI